MAKSVTDKSVNLIGAKRLEKQNTAYENSLATKFRISTEQDQATLNKSKDYIRNKWGVVGYGADADLINDFFEIHPMPSKPNGMTIESDWKVEINGLITGPNGHHPADEIIALKNVLKANVPS